MNKRRPNVVFLVVDAFRADHAGFLGYARPTTPRLDELAARSLVCENAFVESPFTQTATISILTSSRPLSYGGYDNGAKGRPPTLFRHFRDAGYQCMVASANHWVNRYYGYGDGLDREVPAFSINTLPGVTLSMIRSSIAAWSAGQLSAEAMLAGIRPTLMEMFDNLAHYCDWIRTEMPYLRRRFRKASFLAAGYDYGHIAELVEQHRREFVADEVAYVRRHLIPHPKPHEWLVKAWRYKRSRGTTLRLAADEAFSRILGRIDPAAARRWRGRYKSYADAHALTAELIHQIETRDPDRPFVVWTHYLDTHAPYVAGSGPRRKAVEQDYLRQLGYPPLDSSVTVAAKPNRPEDLPAFKAMYDAAIRSTDQAIGTLLDALKRMGLDDDTIVVVMGDHGEEFGEHGEFGHFFVLYDHNVHVPLIIHAPGQPARRVADFVTGLDVAPTVAGLAGLAPAEGWEGRPIDDPVVAGRDHVLLETFYGGNCLFAHRPLYMAVRDRRWKYIWKEWRDSGDKVTPDGHELYDLETDPDEQNNLFGDPAHAERIRAWNILIARRMAEIPEIDPKRVEALLAEQVP